jgi:magnesium and cobalt transporter
MSGNGHGNGNGAADRRNSFFWRLQGLLRRREAESVRDRVEELLEGRPDEGAPRHGDDEGESGLDLNERLLLGNVLRLRDKTAYDVMVPRADIVAMPEDLTLEQTIRLIQREGHSRFPIYRDNLDDIAGMVHIKDVFAAVGRDPAEFSLRPSCAGRCSWCRRCRCSTCCCRCAPRASTWRWWWTNTAASTGW